MEQKRPCFGWFRAVYVFDISQTEGTELPALARSHRRSREPILTGSSTSSQQGIELEYNERIAPAQGASYGGKIVLLPGQSKAETFATLVHELGHEMLHKADRRDTATTKVVRETEAEAIAFIVGKAIGLQTGTASADYIQLYHGNAALLAESLEVIQRTSAVILGALEEPSPEQTPDTPIQQTAPEGTPEDSTRQSLPSRRPPNPSGVVASGRRQPARKQRHRPFLSLIGLRTGKVSLSAYTVTFDNQTTLKESNHAGQQRIPVSRHRHHPRIKHQSPEDI